MDLKCFSAPRAAKQQLAEVRAIEPLLSGVPAPPAFARFLRARSGLGTNALSEHSLQRDRAEGGRGAERSGGRGSPAVPGPYLR